MKCYQCFLYSIYVGWKLIRIDRTVHIAISCPRISLNIANGLMCNIGMELDMNNLYAVLQCEDTQRYLVMMAEVGEKTSNLRVTNS